MKAFLPLLLILGACAGTGTAEKHLGDDLWEIRAWDGRVCKTSTAREYCDEALMPVIRDRAAFVCNQTDVAVDKCQRRDGASGDRIYCLVRCKAKGDKA